MERDTCHPLTFRELFFRYAASLRHFVFFRSADWAGAEDAVQEAFLRLWKNCQAVPPDKAKGFLYTVANNLFFDDTRRKHPAFRFEQYARHAPAGPGNMPVDGNLEAAEMQSRLELALLGLPEPQRTVFLMNRVEKQPYPEIAECLGISVKTVEKRMHAALLGLRESLQIDSKVPD